MVVLIVLPDLFQCPFGLVAHYPSAHSLYHCLHALGVELPHQCKRSCACSTCLIVIVGGKEGVADALLPEQLLLQSKPPSSRLSCQTYAGESGNDANLSVVINISS